MRRILFAGLLCLGCGGPAPLTVDMPLHLEDHLDAATIVGSEVPADLQQPIEWRFDEPQPDWLATPSWNPTIESPRLTQLEDALRLTLTEGTKNRAGSPSGGIHLELPDWRLEDWAYVVVRARTDSIRGMKVGFNRREGSGSDTDWPNPYQFSGDYAPAVTDGSVQTYMLPSDPPVRADPYGSTWEGPLRQLGLWFDAGAPASIDILSISLVPKEASYGDVPAGVRQEVRNLVYRRALYVHAPGRIEYRVRVPEAGRLDVGLGVLRDDTPVTFRITARSGTGEAETLFEEAYENSESWGQRAVDLSSVARQTVTLGLETEAEQPGTVALWGAPTVSGGGEPRLPNIIFYVIDGGAADYMSVYGYNRRTTPNLERLAAEGAVFEHAYSNSSWTRPSTASFMTSLQHSVLGGFNAGGVQRRPGRRADPGSAHAPGRVPNGSLRIQSERWPHEWPRPRR